MDKNIIKKALTEEFVSGEKTTKKVQNISKKANKSYYKDVEKKMKDYDKDLKQEDEDKIDPPKDNYEGSEKEYHDEMEIRNGQEMLKYDSAPSKKFKERAEEAIVGSSKMGNKTYTGKDNGNTESVWGASDDKFGEKLVATAKAANKKRDDAMPARHQFGDDIEVAKGNPRAKSKKIAVESMKRIKFKKLFHGVENAINLIPEAFKVDNKTFELTDGNEKYKIKWEGTLIEGKAVVLEAGDKNLVTEDYDKIKHLMGYNPETTLGSLNAKERVNENKLVKKKINEAGASTTQYRVMWVDGYDGHSEVNKDGFYNDEEANIYMMDLKKDFPNEEYFVEPYSPRQSKPWEERDYRSGVSGGVDGWEDMF